MSVTLRKRKNADGTTSLRLDIYHKGKRWIETLTMLQLSKPSNITDRESNKQKLIQAEKIAVARASDLQANSYSMDTETGKKTIVTVWMQDFINTYQKKDKRNMQGVLNRFIAFLKEERTTGLTFSGLTALIIEDFIEYLEAGSEGEGAKSYYNRFKKMIKQAYRKRLLKDNILDFVERKIKGTAKKKEVLTIHELQILAATPTANITIRNAFLFCCVTGLRWCDVKALKWQDVNTKEKIFKLIQSKTQKEVVNPLNETALKFLGKEGKPGNSVFTLPTANGANKTLKAWVKRAGIKKELTWHCARHSFGTNLVLNNVEVLTASKLLGHTSLKHTYRYIDTAKELKEKAIDKLNFDIE